MIRGERSLIRRLRSRARQAWKKAPTARRRHTKRASGIFSRQHSLTSLRLGLSLLIFLFVAAPDLPLGPLFAWMTLHSVLATLRLASGLARELHEPSRLFIPLLLPLEDRVIFDAHTRPFLAAARALAADWLALGLGLAFWREHALWWVAAPLLALAQGGFAAACALFLARLRPDGRWSALHFLLSCALGAVLVFGRHAEALFTWWWDGGLELVRRVVPFGLFANGAHIAATQNAWLLLWLGVAAVGTISLAWRLKRRWRAAYSTRFLEEHSLEAEPERIAANAEFSPAPEPGSHANGASPAPPAVTAAAEPRAERSSAWDNPYDRALLARDLRLRLDYDPGLAYASQGLLERLFSHLWSARQRRLLPIYNPPPSRWRRRAGVALFIVVATCLVAGFTDNPPSALIGAGVGFALLLPVWEPRWGALWVLFQGPAQSAVHGYLPISLYSLAGAYWSLACAKTLLAGALLVGALVPWIGWAEALHYGALGCGLGLCWAPLAFLFSLSSGTNDSSARWWHSLVLVVLVGGLMVFGVSMLVIAFSADDSRVIAVCVGAAVAGANALLLAHLWATGRRWFDLMSVTRT